jgi:pSer/pThr/pTyr-binding forkhead associated (FHA) protein
MPYIVVKSNGQEIDRREMTRGVVIGRAPDCDITVRDILLSRRHCRLEPKEDGWVVVDLQSKNGTAINGERLIVARPLSDNDVIRLGRSKIIFHAGLPDEEIADRLSMPARPHDPGDSLAGTLSGFTLLLPGESESPENMPCPQPRPKDPPTYSQEELQTLLTAIASSSWDSVYAEARQPLRRPSASDGEEEMQTRRRPRPESPTDFSLQVSPRSAAVAVMERPAPALVLPKISVRRRGFKTHLHVAVAALWIVTLLILNMNHKPVAGGATAAQGDDSPGPVAYMASDKVSSLGADASLLKAADEQLMDRPRPVQKSAISSADAQMIGRTTLFYLPLWY